MHFFTFFDEFLRSAYLNNYRNAPDIVYALNRICQRIWPEPMSDVQLTRLSGIIMEYREKLKECYIEIFEEIDPEN